MLKNYIKIAWRNIWNNKLFSSINVISLAIGLSASFVIGLMVYYEFTFDTFHKDGDRIYRVVSEFQSAEGTFYNSGIPVPMSLTAKEELPGVEDAVYFYTWSPVEVKTTSGSEAFKNPDYTIFTEPAYFEVFDYEWLAGSKTEALNQPAQVVLSQKRAATYFPNLEPHQVIGNILTYNDSIQAVITGVVANFEQRTDLIFEEFVSLPTAAQTSGAEGILTGNWDWTNSSCQVFVKLKTHADIEALKHQLDLLSKAHQSEDSKKFGQLQQFRLQALSDLHFNGDYGIFDFSRSTASLPVLKSLAFIALFLILLGCFNFINLNTAQATQRAKEIGIRKTLGSSRRQLIFQFLGETFMLTLIASVISGFLAIWLLKIFKDFIPNGITLGLFTNPFVLGSAVGLVVLITLAAGIYPGLVLSGFKPATVLKGVQSKPEGKAGLRKVLTAFQFTIAQVFIIATLLVTKQIHFLMNKDMGFKKEAIAYVSTPWHEQAFHKKQVLYDKLKAIPQLEQLSMGGMPPASFSTHSSWVIYQGESDEVRTDLELLYGDSQYLDMYGIKLLAGRTILNDTIEEYIINETAMRTFGFKTPEEALNRNLSNGEENSTIVGVMRDFNQRSLTSGIKPMAFTGDRSRADFSQFRNIHFKLPAREGDNWEPALTKIRSAYRDVYPSQDVDIRFVDEAIARFYDQERRLSKLLSWATGLSVLISGLGLLGLVIHTTERRAKEIGIRKVLGASLAQLNLLLCTDFLKLMVLAYLIAVPIAWWGIHQWLQDYAYKTKMSWWVFALSGIGMVALALVIMSFKTVRTALRNPVKSLRTE